MCHGLIHQAGRISLGGVHYYFTDGDTENKETWGFPVLLHCPTPRVAVILTGVYVSGAPWSCVGYRLCSQSAGRLSNLPDVLKLIWGRLRTQEI